MFNILFKFFTKDSKFDGRLVALMILLVYFLTIYVSSFLTDYVHFWQLLGVPAARPPFSDLYAVTLVLKCPAANSLEGGNPCNPWFAYPKIWFRFSSFWPDAQHYVFLAIAIIIVYYLFVFLVIRKTSVNSGIYYGFLLCSPAIVLATERGQPDLIIFILCALAILIIEPAKNTFTLPNPQHNVKNSIAASLLLLGGFLKLYPFATIASFLSGNKKSSLKMVGLLGLISVAYIYFNLHDIKVLSKSLVEHYFSVSVGFLHGSMVFLTLLNTYPLFHTMFSYFPYSAIAWLVVALFIIILLRQATRQSTILNGDYLFAFRIGSLLYVGSFVIGSNYDYKFIMFLFTIPQLISWLKNNSQIKMVTLTALLAILITCWSSVFSRITYWLVFTFFEESLNWYIFGYFIYMLGSTMPDWVKRLIGSRQLATGK